LFSWYIGELGKGVLPGLGLSFEHSYPILNIIINYAYYAYIYIAYIIDYLLLNNIAPKKVYFMFLEYFEI